MGTQNTIFIPLGYALTLTTDGFSAGTYLRLGSPGGTMYNPVAISASSSAIIGPFNEPRTYQYFSDGNLFTESLDYSGTFTGSDDSSYAPIASPTFTGTMGFSSGSKMILDHGTDTEAANAVTINAQSGTITTSALTTAASSSYLVTLTNSKIVGTGSVIIASIAGGTNTVKDISVEAICTAASTATLTIYNNVLITTALNGTVKINFAVF